jgi:hypothetical protein
MEKLTSLSLSRKQPFMKSILFTFFITTTVLVSIEAQDWQVDQGLMRFTYEDTPGPPPAGPLISRWEVGIGNSFTNPDLFSIGIYKFVLDYIIRQNALVINPDDLFVGVGTELPVGRLHIDHLNSLGTQKPALYVGPTTGAAQGYLNINKPEADNNTNIARFRDDGATKVSINESEATYQLEVFGDINADNLFMVSDANLKTNIQDLKPGATQLLHQLRPRSYDFKTKMKNHRQLPTEPQLGLLAQELKEVLPNLVREKMQTDEDGNEMGMTMAVNYLGLIPILIASNQEIDKSLQEMQIKHQVLQQAYDKLWARLEKLEQASQLKKS